MATSRAHQKQKLNLIKPSRLAPTTSRPSVFLPQTLRTRLTVLTLSLLAGVGVSGLVLAAQQQEQADKNAQASQTHTTDINVDATTSPSKAEVFLTPNNVTMDITSSATEPSTAADTSVTINGQPTPLVDGTVSKQYISSDGSSVDINISVGSSSTNSSSGTSSDISIDSSSFSTESDQDTVRGLPRR